MAGVVISDLKQKKSFCFVHFSGRPIFFFSVFHFIESQAIMTIFLTLNSFDFIGCASG